MPIYEFLCTHYSCLKISGVAEVIMPISQCDVKKIPCPNCGCEANKIISVPGNIQLGKPTRMFQNPLTGDVFPAMNEYQKPPRGFKEIELKNPIERSAFEKEQQRLVDGKNQFTSYHLDSLKAESRQKRHDDLNARMNAVQREVDPVTGETIEFTLDHKEQALVKKAMDKSKRKKAKEKKSNVMLAINHNNSNNLDQMK